MPVLSNRIVMMRKRTLIFLGCFVCLAGISAVRERYRTIPNESFTTGEKIEYRVHYGFINAAEAKVEIAKHKFVVNNRPCYKVNVTARTVGAFDLISKVRDTWRSHIDTSAIITQLFYRSIQENSFRKEEVVTFNHAEQTATAKVRDVSKTFNVPENVQDIVSAYYYLRTINFDTSEIGEIFVIPIFFEDQVYRLRVRYAGRDQIRTKFGRIRVFKLNPLLPDNRLFKGENSIRIWVSDDENKIPVKAEADLWIGAIAMDIKGYKNLRTSPQWAE